MSKKRRNKNWSYNAGERGRNWVRAYRQKRDGRYYLEWIDDGRRRSAVLKHVSSEEEAKNRADQLASKFATLVPGKEPTTLDRVIDRYLEEVTPRKGVSKQQHDRRCARLWRSYFAAQPEKARQTSRTPDSLDRVDWDRFVSTRRAGGIPGWPRPVRDRAVEYDLKFMVAVLTWAVGAKIIDANPWGAETRTAQRWSMPREKNPTRRSMPDDLLAGLIDHSPSWQFEAMLRIGRETGRRNNSVRQLRWSDVDFQQKRVTWRAETDKAGRRHVATMVEAVEEVLRGLPTRAIGDLPVFPGGDGEPVSRHTCQVWLRRAKARLIASAPKAEREHLRKRLDGVGFHSLKRSKVREPGFRALPPAIQSAYVGTDYRTLARIYDDVTPEDQRAAIEAVKETMKDTITGRRKQRNS
ncbi:MAG: tyrosine-type recombinase/integrase [Gemmatimonadetes bacterium]|nr:tyrosine-type recombinase/integrase [Gemmatimonadota bacterium]